MENPENGESMPEYKRETNNRTGWRVSNQLTERAIDDGRLVFYNGKQAGDQAATVPSRRAENNTEVARKDASFAGACLGHQEDLVFSLTGDRF